MRQLGTTVPVHRQVVRWSPHVLPCPCGVPGHHSPHHSPSNRSFPVPIRPRADDHVLLEDPCLGYFSLQVTACPDGVTQPVGPARSRAGESGVALLVVSGRLPTAPAHQFTGLGSWYTLDMSVRPGLAAVGDELPLQSPCSLRHGLQTLYAVRCGRLLVDEFSLRQHRRGLSGALGDPR